MGKKKKDKSKNVEISSYGKLCMQLAFAETAMPADLRLLLASCCPSIDLILSWILLEARLIGLNEASKHGVCGDPGCKQNHLDASAGLMTTLDLAIERLTYMRIEISRYHDKLKV